MPLRNSNLSMPQMAAASSSSSSSMSASTSASVSSAASASAVTESSEPDRERERERTRNRVSARIHNATRIRAQRTPSFAVQKLKSKIANAHPLLHHHHSRTGHDENEQVPWRRDAAAEESVHVGERPRDEIAAERQEIDSRAVVLVNASSSGALVNDSHGSHESHASHGNGKQSSSASPAELSRKVEEQIDREKVDLEKNVQRSLDRRKPKLTADARAFLHNRAEKRRQHIAAAKEKVSRKAALLAPGLARQLSHNKHKEQQQQQQQQQQESAAVAVDISQSEQSSLVKNESLSANPAVPIKEANLEHLSSSPSSSPLPLPLPSPVQSVLDFDEFEDVVVAVESIADEALFREARAASEVALMTRDSVSATAPTSSEQVTEPSPNANTEANTDAGANANASADISKPTAARPEDRDRNALDKKGREKQKDRVGKESALQFARSKSKAISIRLKAGRGGVSSNKASDSAGAASAPVLIVAPSKSRWRKRRPDGAESNSNAEKSSGDEAKSDAEHKEEPAKAVKEAVEVIGKDSDMNTEKELEPEEENIVRSLLHDDFIEYQAYMSRDKGRGRKLRPPWAFRGAGKESESD